MPLKSNSARSLELKEGRFTPRSRGADLLRERVGGAQRGVGGRTALLEAKRKASQAGYDRDCAKPSIFQHYVKRVHVTNHVPTTYGLFANYTSRPIRLISTPQNQ
jgi:hypothetical protein